LDKRLLTPYLFVIVGFAVGCDPSGEPTNPIIPAGDVSIPVSADKRGAGGYRPNPLVVKQGATVTWTNHDSIWHTVTSDVEGVFGSEPIPARGIFTHAFAESGTFPYHCAIPGHQMTGVVTVEP
jgi:plastocyanin